MAADQLTLDYRRVRGRHEKPFRKLGNRPSFRNRFSSILSGLQTERIRHRIFQTIGFLPYLPPSPQCLPSSPERDKPSTQRPRRHAQVSCPSLTCRRTAFSCHHQHQSTWPQALSPIAAIVLQKCPCPSAASTFHHHCRETTPPPLQRTTWYQHVRRRRLGAQAWEIR